MEKEFYGKNIYFLALLTLTTLSIYNCYAQGNKIETLYFDAGWNAIDREHKVYFRTLDSQRHGLTLITDHYSNGKKQMLGSYTNPRDENTRNGYFVYFDTSGHVDIEGNYINSERQGAWKYHYNKYDLYDADLISRVERHNDSTYYEIYQNIGTAWNVCNGLKVDSAIMHDFNAIVFTRFLDTMYFVNTEFYTLTKIHKNYFGFPVIFNYDSLNVLDLSANHYKSNVYFTSDHVRDLMSFAQDTFDKTITFNDITFGKNAQLNFSGAVLPDTIDFSGCNRISNIIDLTAASFKNPLRTDTLHDDIPYRRHYINLYKSDISKFRLDYDHFQLYFPRGIKPEEKNSVYEALLNNFKTHGQSKSYQLLDTSYKNFRYRDRGQGWRIYIDKWWWNYGYNKELVFVHSLFFLLFFSFITFWILNFLNDEVYGLDDIKYDIPLSMSAYFRRRREKEDKDDKPLKNNYMSSIGKKLLDYGSEHDDNTKSYKILAGGSNLDQVFTGSGMDVEVRLKRNENSEYKPAYKTIVYIIFLLSIAAAVVGFVILETKLPRIHLVHILAHSFLKYSIAVALVAITIFLLWLKREQLKDNKYISFIDSLWSRGWLSFVYTSKLFFPLFIQIEKIKYKHQFLVFYILFVYAVGLLCVGYMTNFIFQK